MKYLKKIFKHLPDDFLVIVKKFYYLILIKRDKFVSPEKEFELLKKIIVDGAKVIDIGANIGHYTILFSRLVGDNGRVLAFEPIPKTFDILVSNINNFKAKNVTLINAAISDMSREANFTVPNDNLYQSNMDNNGEIHVMCFPLTAFLPKDWECLFIKIDAEGGDEDIIRNSIDAINNLRPIVMAELNLNGAGKLVDIFIEYSIRGIKGSHNSFFVPNEKLDSFPVE